MAAAVSGGDTSTVYFTAGLAGEAHGLFGAIANNPTPTGTATFGLAASTAGVTASAGSSASAVISIAPTNNFSGTVNLTCNNLPAATTCSFSASPVSVTATSSALSTVTIQTTKMAANTGPNKLQRSAYASITWAMILPFGCAIAFRRRRSSASSPLRLLGIMALLIGSAGFLTACGTTYPQIAPSTPTGTTNVIITATSGATLTQSTTLALTVQ